MPPSLIRLVPIMTASPSRTLAVPVMSAACAATGSHSMVIANRNFRRM